MKFKIQKITNIICFLILFHASSINIFAQSERDSIENQNYLEYLELINARLEKYYYGITDLIEADTVQFSDTIIVNSLWCLSDIIQLCSNEETTHDGYRILSRYLKFYDRINSRIKIYEIGYGSIPNVEALLRQEQKFGYINIPTIETTGCVRSSKIVEIVQFIEHFEY